MATPSATSSLTAAVVAAFGAGLASGILLASYGTSLIGSSKSRAAKDAAKAPPSLDTKAAAKSSGSSGGSRSPVKGGVPTLLLIADEQERMAISRILSSLEQDFRLPTSKLHEIVKHFIAELNKGLAKPGQTIKALPSYVTKRPTGNERGTLLALDLGGTNLRVCEVVLEGRGKHRMRQKKYTVSEEIKVSTARVMFDFIADVVAQFLDEYRISGGRKGQTPLKLGFTFSYPVDQSALDVGTLMNWNKGFDVKGVVGKDVVALLHAALERKNLNIDIVAIVNDTVGTLISHAYEDPETYVGVILGTGTNAAYVEKIENIPKWKTHYDAMEVPSGEMIVNIEWGNFDAEKVILPLTSYDKALDAETENAGRQLLEKMISGMYLGEIARLILRELFQDGSLFAQVSGKSPRLLQTPFEFETQYMSRIERDHSQDLSDTKALLEDLLHIKESTLQDRLIVKRVCELVGIRSARLSAACVAGVLSKMNRLDGCTVAIDGSVFEHYPHFKNRMTDALREIFGLSAENVTLSLARDGSGVGAALIAAIMGTAE